MTAAFSEENNAKYYDIIYRDWISEDYTQSELTLIKKYLPPHGSVLDVGCGSGRHAIPLHREGYRVTAVEPIKTFVAMVHRSSPQIPISNCTFQAFETVEKYDVIISMWNAFHQLAYTTREAKDVLCKMKGLLTKNGSILLSLTPGEAFSIDGYNFTLTEKEGDKEYKLDWSVVDFDESTKTVTSLEHIAVYDSHGNKIDDSRAHVKQRFWREEDIRRFAEELDLKLTVVPGKTEDSDAYYIFQK